MFIEPTFMFHRKNNYLIVLRLALKFLSHALIIIKISHLMIG